MIIIRHIEGRRSERIAWLLEELGVPYELDFIQGDILGSLVEIEKYHEMRVAPVMHDGDVVMVESGAILEYLLNRYGKGSGLRPAEDAPEFPAYLQFLHFAEGTAMAKILTTVADMRYAEAMKESGLEPPQQLPELPGYAGSHTGAQRILHYAENTLAIRPYFAGEAFTAADIMMHFPLKLGAPVAAGVPYDLKVVQSADQPYLEAYPNVRDFLRRIAQRPAYQRAMHSTMPGGPPDM